MTTTPTALPQSKLARTQYKHHEKTYKNSQGETQRLVVLLRYDDDCKNGHNSFSITAQLYDKHSKRGDCSACGCLHDEIAKHAPELAPFIKWHLVSSDCPMHYLSNTVYHASNLDHNGLLKDEARQIKNGKTGLPCWILEEETKLPEKYVDSETKPEFTGKISYKPWMRIGEGKDRDLNAARHSAVWPEATDEELMLPRIELEKLLIARLPSLMEQFKTDMETLGFIY